MSSLEIGPGGERRVHFRGGFTIQGRPTRDVALALNSISNGVYVTPWVDAIQDANGNWLLPEYPCEITDLPVGHEKNKTWKPGEYIMGVDNIDEQGNVFEAPDVDVSDRLPFAFQRNLQQYPHAAKEISKVPHLPGQPLKEMLACLKALEPRRFDDRYFEGIHRDLPEEWRTMVKRIQFAESFGVQTEEVPAEWSGQQEELTPSVYPTPRMDTVTLCVGITGYDQQIGPALQDMPGAEYDFLEFLYAKDQEDKVISIHEFTNQSMTRSVFSTYSFVPPKGTTSITPYACFKIRGAWKGLAIDWDASVGSEEMQWFTDMPPEMRAQLADRTKLQGENKLEVESIRYPAKKKQPPVLWPENSWEGNAAKARMWDEMNQ